MIKRILGILIPLITCATLVAQSEPLISWTRIIKPKSGKQEQFVKAVAAKTEKFNSQKGDEVIRTYRIIDGPDEGSFVRTGLSGPWAQFDETSEQQQAGYDYWFKHVAPYIDSGKGRQFWSTSAEMSYNGTGKTGPPAYVMLRYYNIKPNTSFAKLAKQTIETSKATNADFRLGWYRLESGGDRSTWVFASVFNSFSELDEGNSGFWAAYEKHNGEGSAAKWFEEFGNILQANPNARAATIYKYRPDMSTPE